LHGDLPWLLVQLGAQIVGGGKRVLFEKSEDAEQQAADHQHLEEKMNGFWKT
jgi:hypothetical protein